MIEDQEYYFRVNKQILKDRLSIISSWYVDATLWSSGNSFIELINNQHIKIRVIIPIIETNVPIGTKKSFHFNFFLKTQSLKNMRCDDLIIKYSGKTFKIMGTSQTEKTIYNTSKEEPHDQFINRVTFLDTYPLDSNNHPLTINDPYYCNDVGSFVVEFSEFVTFINKTSSIKSGLIKFYLKEGNINLTSLNTLDMSANTLIVTYRKRIDLIFDPFHIDIKYLEPIKSINISLSNSKKRESKIYNELLFKIIRYQDNILGIRLFSNQDNSNISVDDFFIFFPCTNLLSN